MPKSGDNAANVLLPVLKKKGGGVGTTEAVNQRRGSGR